MKLEDLFVSHKQVNPVSFSFEEPSLPTTLYSNYDRASKATQSDTSKTQGQEQDMSTWKVGGSDPDNSVWVVDSKFNQQSGNTNDAKSKDQQAQQTQQEDKAISKQDQVVRKARSFKPGSWNNPYRNDKQLWKKDMVDAYKRAGLGDNAIKNLIAKNALESGWGRSAQGAYNFGNITTGSRWSGKYVDGRDTDANGNPITNRFRAYDSLDDYVTDEIQFLTKLYDFNANDDFDTFIGKLLGNNSGKRRYAEDRQYATKVRSVYNSI